jgi:hypothetical protein
MAWLLHQCYLAGKILFFALCAYLAIGMAYLELSEGRVGIGTGTCTVVIFGAIKGFMGAQRD